MSEFRFRGAVAALTAAERRSLFDRSTSSDPAIRQRTAKIVDGVRAGGDEALRQLARELDGVALDAIEVPREAITFALQALDPALRAAMERAAANIERAHSAFRPRAAEVETEPGIIVGRRPDPLGRVGVYAPGGRAAYPSSVLMGAIPARVAGVGEVILCSPPTRDNDGLPSTVVLAAAALAGVDRVFAIGGAGAVAAMAYGTANVPRVDRIVGPGNAYVAEAKLQVSGAVAIDSPAGPSELLAIVDDSCDPDVIAREVLAQAEHDPLAAVVVVAIGERVAGAVQSAVLRRLPDEPRGGIAGAALAARGGVLVASDVAEAVRFSNEWAPEHLLLVLRDAEAALAAVRNAGTVFVGSFASVAFGDYMTGANHVLPTGGLARSYSGLSTLDFVRWTTYQRVTREAAASLSADVGLFADSEGLPAHAAAARQWAGQDEEEGARRRMHLARAAYREVPVYAPHGAVVATEGAVDVSDNTNLWGTPPAAAAALRELADDGASRYPSLYAHELKPLLARHAGVDEQAIVTGCGSDDVLDSTMRAFAEPGDRIAFPVPTFGMVPTFALMNGLVPVGVPLRGADAGWDVDVEGLLAARARIIYLCSPNNPTGTLVSRRAIREVVQRAPGLVIIDEAYAEFAGISDAAVAPALGNVIVTRTLSKAFGLAGLRIGYGVGAPALVREVEKARGPYMVSAAAQRAARAALEDDRQWVADRVRDAVAERAWLAERLAAMGIEALPSRANFLLVPVPDAIDAAARLLSGGVLVRAFANLPVIGDALRIGVGPREVMQQVLSVCADVLVEPAIEARRA